ncbi:prephenate dehydrogenase [Lactiplantibacillus fabifermentans]|uniref:Prephenate dehydrogenase n=2 Tax=Lactiplantibacillus fabifermentans TaxID=483011 RepID=A0A0R2NQC9_9LACO|nr:prephenate dehydrogenase [Lactiplantibacillus fabifermentans]ETY74660.1 prephenate dehydrogenase [Lactiplantibacillus fabifermentans T30PCM01]KRO26099.1 prephenate dehydrogenase [Lactiplantibacillus fabifermentans DSM 21115]
MTKVLINGLGLIGSSLALAIKQVAPAVTIVGSDRQSATLSQAQAHQIVDEVTTDFSKAALAADVIILAGPVSVITANLAELATLTLKPHVLVTDVGSTKQSVMRAARPLQQQGITFIGGHPLAGSHKSGVLAGRANLFENAYYLLVPGLADTAAIQQLQQLLRGLHVKWLTVTAIQHDRLVSQISHLPHVVAAALVNQTQNTLADSPLGLRLAAGGFKSITRIASADPTMWTAILLNNATQITSGLQGYIDELTQVQAAITAKNEPAITRFFTQAKTTRDALGPERLGSLPNFYDLFLNVPDQVGALADVTQRLAAARLNLVNIHILEIREEVDGVLQLTFDSAATQTQAAQLLAAANYQIVRKS